MLTRDQKKNIVDDFADRFKRQKIAFFSDFHGVSVAKMQALRRLLKKSDAEYKVAKKTLFDKALEKAGVKLETKKLQGEIGVTFAYEDELAPAKTLYKFSRQNDTFKILGGILGGRILSGKEILAFAKLPGREILLAQLLGVLQSPMRGLATVLAGNIKNLVVVINKIKEKKI